MRTLPAAFAAAIEPAAIRSAKETISALMKPRSKSVWMTPAALRGGVALVDRPGPGLLRPGGQVGLQAEGVEAGAGQRVQARLVLADRLQQLHGGLVVELEQLGLDLGVEEHRIGGRDRSRAALPCGPRR